MKSIVLLSGPVGAGKTTVARELIACSDSPTTYIEGDSFWTHVARAPENQTRHKRFKMIMTAMVGAALPYALYGNEAIVDFSIPPWFLETVDKVVRRKEITVEYIVLRPPQDICAVRAASRKEGRIACYEGYGDLYDDFREVARRHLVINDHSDPKETAKLIREGLSEGTFRLL